MTLRTKEALYAGAGAALAVWIGANIADESYGLAAAVALASLWLVVAKVSESPPQVWLLAVILVGYIVGNRGFAQLQPIQRIPLLPAEATLLVAVPALVLRIVFKKTSGAPKDALNLSIIIWMALGVLRLPLDFREFGVMAVRDFAMVYYAAFFFVAQDLASNPRSANLLRSSMTWAFVLLLPAVIGVQIAPNFFLEHLTWRGIPLIYHKSDLIAMSLAAGFFWLWTRWEASWNRAWAVAAFTSLLLIGIMDSPRAGICAVAVVTLIWVLSGRWRVAAYQAGVVLAAAGVGLAVAFVSGNDIKTSRPYSMYEHVISIFDPAGTGTYINNETGDLGGNNQFRLIWWRDVIEDTAATKPIMGLGFGSDLSTRFLADFNLLNDESFAARSPHSMLVTVFGRMGILGFAAWIAVSFNMGVTVWRLTKNGEPNALGLASVVIVVWVSACFGVVLEGPMGAVIFWSALGLANSLRRKQALEKVPKEGSAEWPVAKPGAIATQSSLR